jgi:PAS domain S-box-containing protein
MGVNRVLSTLEQREVALVQSEAFRHSIIASVSIGIAVLDPGGIVVSVNAPWRRMVGMQGTGLDAVHPSRDRAIGTPYVEVCKEAAGWGSASADADCMSKTCAGIRAVLDGSEPVFSMDYSTQNGTETRWFQMVMTPLGLPAPGAVASHTDITERTLASRALAASEERFALFMNTLPAIAFIKDESGAILFANRHMENMLGPRGWRSKDAAALYPPEVAQHMVDADRRAIEAGYAMSEDEVPSADGTRSLYQVHKFAIARHQKSSLLGCIALDISVQKKAEIALREAKAEADAANKAKSVFLASASHDLGQPLSALSLYVELLKDQCAPENRLLVERIEACSTGMNDLLSNLLDLSKLEVGAVVPAPSNFAVNGLLHALVSVHFAEASVKGLRLALRPSALMACTDPALLTRLVGNLIANAIRYTATGGVLVACRHSAGRYWIEVWDTGVGIPAEKMETVFEEFTQLATVGPKQGSGLGLAIVAKTAAVLGLKIRMQSRPGRGSMFAVELPTVQAVTP